MNLRVFSMFSGVSAASIAWKPLGYEIVGYCEPAAFPAHVLNRRLDATAPKYLPEGKEFAAKNYDGMERGRIVNFGDIEQITDDDLRSLGQLDLAEGASPSQAFSAVGRHAGLNDLRSNLAFVFARLALQMKEINGLRLAVWENVLGVLSHADNPLGHYLAALCGEQDPVIPPGTKWPNSGHVLVRGEGEAHATIAWGVLRAEDFGAPQRRHSLVVVASFDPDIDAARILFEREGKSWRAASGRCAGQEGSGDCAGSTVTALIGMDSDTTIQTDPTAAYTLKASNDKNVQAVIYPKPIAQLSVETVDTSQSADQGKELDPASSQLEHARIEYVCRRLMPLECERLQGLPDGWTDITINGRPARDGVRYRAIGNSSAVPCLAFIGERLKQLTDRLYAAQVQHAA